MFCSENPTVAISALIRPITSNDSSVSVAIPTPVMIGTRLRYTVVVCFSLRMIRDSNTVNSGIVAFTTIKNSRFKEVRNRNLNM